MKTPKLKQRPVAGVIFLLCMALVVGLQMAGVLSRNQSGSILVGLAAIYWLAWKIAQR